MAAYVFDDDQLLRALDAHLEVFAAQGARREDLAAFGANVQHFFASAEAAKLRVRFAQIDPNKPDPPPAAAAKVAA